MRGEGEIGFGEIIELKSGVGWRGMMTEGVTILLSERI